MSPNLLSIDDIACLYGIDRRTAQRRIRRLERAGWLAPLPSESDRYQRKLYDAPTVERLFREHFNALPHRQAS